MIDGSSSQCYNHLRTNRSMTLPHDKVERDLEPHRSRLQVHLQSLFVHVFDEDGHEDLWRRGDVYMLREHIDDSHSGQLAHLTVRLIPFVPEGDRFRARVRAKAQSRTKGRTSVAASRLVLRTSSSYFECSPDLGSRSCSRRGSRACFCHFQVECGAVLLSLVIRCTWNKMG